MIKSNTKRIDEPLNSHDLGFCQRVFDTVRDELGVARNSEEAERIAAITIELYRQGVRNEGQLKLMVGAARGLVLR
jgi:hypothetical protein